MATVLVVDDDGATRSLVRIVLENAGHRIVEAGNSSDALARAAEERPDLILLDLSLGATSGTEFLRRLRASDATRAMRVALYTATPMSPALRDFMAIYGVAGVVPKPCEPLELAESVARALEPS